MRPFSEYFWSAYSRIRTEYGEILRMPRSVVLENYQSFIAYILMLLLTFNGATKTFYNTFKHVVVVCNSL